MKGILLIQENHDKILKASEISRDALQVMINEYNGRLIFIPDVEAPDTERKVWSTIPIMEFPKKWKFEPEDANFIDDFAEIHIGPM
jgi:hypothetical protein